jgi:hypothetical protein
MKQRLRSIQVRQSTESTLVPIFHQKCSHLLLKEEKLHRVWSFCVGQKYTLESHRLGCGGCQTDGLPDGRGTVLRSRQAHTYRRTPSTKNNVFLANLERSGWLRLASHGCLTPSATPERGQNRGPDRTVGKAMTPSHYWHGGKGPGCCTRG